MTTATSLDRELLEVEKAYWDAIQKKDRAAIQRLTGDTFIITMGEGITPMTSDEFTEMMLSGETKIRSYKLDEQGARVSRPVDDVAIIAYRARMDYERQGKPNSLDAFYTTTWVRQGERWRAVASSESPVANAAS